MPVLDPIVWKEPRPRHKAPDYTKIAEQLRANPGRTGLIAEFPTEVASGSTEAIRLRYNATHGNWGFKHQSGTFEATTRTVTATDGSKTVQVYATFTPRTNR